MTDEDRRDEMRNWLADCAFDFEKKYPGAIYHIIISKPLSRMIGYNQRTLAPKSSTITSERGIPGYVAEIYSVELEVIEMYDWEQDTACDHQWINVGFNSLRYVCRLCNEEHANEYG